VAAWLASARAESALLGEVGLDLPAEPDRAAAELRDRLREVGVLLSAERERGPADSAQLRGFGEPYQVGLDSGDQTWRWFYAEHGVGSEVSKDFTVRFNPNGTVKSYSFTSNFPDDMKRLR